jgi:cytochrome b561
MKHDSAARTYARVRQAIHWTAVLLVLTMIPTGLVMADTLDDGLRLTLYQVHLLVGWLVVALAIWRVVLRFRQRVPAPAELAPWNRRLLHVVHWTVAVFPLLLAVSGVGAIVQNDLVPVLQAGEAPPATLDVATARTGHQIGAYLFTALLVVHVAGIVRHQVRFGGALAPMLRRRR